MTQVGPPDWATTTFRAGMARSLSGEGSPGAIQKVKVRSSQERLDGSRGDQDRVQGGVSGRRASNPAIRSSM